MIVSPPSSAAESGSFLTGYCLDLELLEERRFSKGIGCEVFRDPMLDSRAVDSFSIRRAVVSEQKELEALQLRASLTNAGDRDALLAHLDAIELPAQQIAEGGVFVSERNGAIVGFAALLPREDGQVELDALFVDPTIRRSGVGRSLVEHCVQIVHAQGCGALCVIGNPHAYDFYSACGFNVVGKTETRFGPALLMRKLV
jgi:N-acetylglutamate synthase-like GNAT family acetyltransferase